MPVPPGLLGAGLLLWGWQMELWLPAAFLAALLEGARLLPWRWRLGERELNRIVDACGLAFAALALYAVVGGPFASAILTVLRWTPAALAPLILIQHYSDRQRLPLSALSLHQRKRGNRHHTVDVGYPYFVLCLIAASTGNRTAPAFYLLITLLWAWALWAQRNRRFPPGVWAMLLLAGGSLGYLTGSGLSQLQELLEEQAPGWLLAWLEPQTDPYRQSTALGAVSRLKRSGRIVLRIPAAPGGTVPERLRSAGYNFLWGHIWAAKTGPFTGLDRQAELGWQIQPRSGPGPGRALTILHNLSDGRGLLPLPEGALHISGLAAESVARNPLGTVSVLGAPEVIRYRVRYDPTGDSEPPTAEDSRIPPTYRKDLMELGARLGLPRSAPGQVPDILTAYFNEHFTYSLELRVIDGTLPPLLDFLHNTRSGHCEYFASATVLLLRQAGIPARYITGYSVQEYSPLEQRYIVRRRHAHAWASAYLDGRWQPVDTTPAIGWAVDARLASPWTGVYDVLSWLWTRVQEWRMRQDAGAGDAIGWLLLPLLLLLVWRLRRQQRVRRQNRAGSAPLLAPSQGPGADSECYRIAAWYQARGLEHPVHEPLALWLQRLARDGGRGLDEILGLHYRYRFDPLGLSAGERRRLHDLVQAWLKR